MKIEPADVAWVGLLAGALAIDVELDRHGRALLSHRVLGKVIAGLLAAHLSGRLPRRLDPFAVVGVIAARHPIRLP